jgi:hypothetical protein
MQTLIERVRRMIGDPASDARIFSDEEIQDRLDERRIRIVSELLEEVPELSTTGWVHKTYTANRGAWEGSPALVDGDGAALTPSTSDLINGVWIFTADTDPPVRITGYLYDLNGSAADLLDDWAAKHKLEYEFTTDGQEFREQQKFQQLGTLAAKYRRRQWPRVMRMSRRDIVA